MNQGAWYKRICAMMIELLSGASRRVSSDAAPSSMFARDVCGLLSNAFALDFLTQALAGPDDAQRHADARDPYLASPCECTRQKFLRRNKSMSETDVRARSSKTLANICYREMSFSEGSSLRISGPGAPPPPPQVRQGRRRYAAPQRNSPFRWKFHSAPGHSSAPLLLRHVRSSGWKTARPERKTAACAASSRDASGSTPHHGTFPSFWWVAATEFSRWWQNLHLVAIAMAIWFCPFPLKFLKYCLDGTSLCCKPLGE